MKEDKSLIHTNQHMLLSGMLVSLVDHAVTDIVKAYQMLIAHSKAWVHVTLREGVLPYHVYSCAQLGVLEQRQGNGLPQVVTGYDPDPVQTVFIQSVPQQLVQSRRETENRATLIHSSDHV